jgi:hypothetical protein
VCQDDGCCSGCNVCGHCSTALLAAFQVCVPAAGYMSCAVTLLPQAPHPSAIFQPPRVLSLS